MFFWMGFSLFLIFFLFLYLKPCFQVLLRISHKFWLCFGLDVLSFKFLIVFFFFDDNWEIKTKTGLACEVSSVHLIMFNDWSIIQWHESLWAGVKTFLFLGWIEVLN